MLRLRVLALAPFIALCCLSLPPVSSVSAMQVIPWSSGTSASQGQTGQSNAGLVQFRTVQMPSDAQASAPAAPSGQPSAPSAPSGQTGGSQLSSSGPTEMRIVQMPAHSSSGSVTIPVYSSGSGPAQVGTPTTSTAAPSANPPAPSPVLQTQPQTLLVPSAFGQAPPAPPANQADLAQQFLAMVNQVRAQHNEGPLADNPLLDQLALAKAQDLVVYNYFDHYSPRLGWPIDQEQKAGFRALYMGAENMAVAGSIQQVLQHLLASPTHLENLLDPGFTQTGIAVVVLPGANSVLVDQFFAGPSY